MWRVRVGRQHGFAVALLEGYTKWKVAKEKEKEKERERERDTGMVIT